MSVAAIICEYNPFHAGHQYQIRETRRRLGPETGVLCLMSGNYVQRGEPAVYDKWARARAAVEGGADLCMELPMTVAVNAAGYFAFGGVECLHKLNYVNYICFGSDLGTAETLTNTARAMNAPEYEAALRDTLKAGASYAKAREQALYSLGMDGVCLTGPNSALGVDYLRRLLTLESPMEPLVIPRDASLPTASQIRAGLAEQGAPIHTREHGERAMLAVLRTLPDEAFQSMPFGGEGLWSKVMKACRREDSLEEILAACKSKRYTMSRLKRILLCLFLGLSREDLARAPPYLRVLAFNDRGRGMLRDLKKTSGIPLITKRIPDTPEARAYFALESRATDLYGLFAPANAAAPAGREKTMGPSYIKMC